MLKKIIFITTILIILIPVVLFMLWSNQRSAPQQNDIVTPTPVKLRTGDIETSNFLKNPVATNNEGDALIVKTPDYQITYLKPYDEFIISVNSTSSEARTNAENAFLQKLSISQKDACDLNVNVNTPYVSDEQAANRRLSFC